jgi:hypothetical protein
MVERTLDVERYDENYNKCWEIDENDDKLATKKDMC